MTLVNEKENLTQSNPLSQKVDFTWQISNACKVHFDQFQDGIGGHEVLTLHQYLIASNPFKKWEKLWSNNLTFGQSFSHN